MVVVVDEGEDWRLLMFKAYNCDDLISKWEGMYSSDGSSETDIWPFFKNLASDVISRTTFGSSYEEGRRIFQLLKEQNELTLQTLLKVNIPGWR
ncbi:hypothetical protein JHK87_024580 [Glycine soja]|nr:hypothetical protein JHK87_024580 [Glycine soja]